MQPFVFHNPTKIVFGVDTVTKVGKYAAAWGRKALLVYGQGSIKRSGVYAQVTAALRDSGIEWLEHSGVKSNPVLSHVRAGVKMAREQQVDVVVAVGGGSVLDEAKSIAAGALADNDVWDFFTGAARPKQALPLVTVLTLAATGSEMNCGGVVTNEQTKQKFDISAPCLYPKVSILDPQLTCSVPADYTAYSAVDAISHLLEGYFTSREQTPLQDRFVEGLVQTIMESTDQILRRPDDIEARATMMWAASWALNGLSTAGIGAYGFPNHMIEHSLSAMYDIAHGAGLAVVMPGWMSWAAQRDANKFAQFARRVFALNGADDSELAAAGIAALKRWFAASGAPVTLVQAGIAADDIPAIAANATMLAQKWGLRDYSAAVIEEILRRCC